MRAVLRLAAHKLRVRWRGWAFLVLLIGLAGGAVLTAAAGALRTDSAYPRFLQASRASDVLVSPLGTGLRGYYDALARLPDVAAIAPLVGLQALPLEPGGKTGLATVAAPLDGGFGHLLEIPKMLAGRQPMPDRPGEVAVDQIAAADLHLRVGSRLELGAFAGSDTRHARLLSERVVGIVVTRGSVVPITDLDKTPIILASSALFRELGPSYEAFDGAYVKLRPGATVGGFSRLAQALAHRLPATGGQVIVADEATQAAAVERSIRPQAVALALFALVLAVTALLVVGQVASRLLLAASRDNGTLAALGMTRGQLLAVGLIEVGAAAAAGAAVACGLAIAASPLMPIGPARLAEPDPGVSVDIAVLATGFAATVIMLVARVAWPAWRQASARPSGEQDAASASGRRSRAAEWLARADAPVTAVTGVRLALDPGRGRAAVPVRSALVGLVIAVTAVAAAVTFGGNLLRLVDTPRLYGQDWDVALDLQFGTITARQFEGMAAAVPGIAGWTFGYHGTLGIGNAVVPAIGLTTGHGPLATPTLLTGHPPRSSQQIVLGTSVLRQMGLHVGESVPVTASGRRYLAQIVGSAVFPYFGEGSFTPTDVGEGAEATAALLAPQAEAADNGSGYNFVLVRFAPGSSVAADIANFERVTGTFCATVEQSTCVVTDQRPNAIVNYALIDGTPEVLAGILAVLGLAVLGQFVVASARRRRRDFAIMKVLGLLRGQVSAITAWQVTTLTGLALLIGLPLGVAAGHWAWELFAGNVGLSPGAITPMALLWMIPVTLVLANVIALGPGQVTARLSPAAALRAE
jgi:ABC-type antimicrobial peptide transport system permease subunit